MNKHDLIIALSERLSLPQTECLRIVNAWQQVLEERLVENDRIILQGFGTFSPWVQVERDGRNPRTGEPCVIAPRISVKFKPGKYLLQALNAEEDKS